MIKRTTAVLAIAVGAMASTAGSAAANGQAAVHCGDVLTHSVKLAADLTNCPSDGLVIGADHVTVDLNGHTLAGSRSEDTYTVGIIDRDAHSNTTVKNGRITRFGDAIGLIGPEGQTGRDSTVRHITGTGNSFQGYPGGIYIAYMSHVRVTRSTIDGGGLLLFGVTHGLADHNVIHDGEGIWLLGDELTRVTRNTVRDIVNVPRPGIDNVGIHLLEGTSNTTVDHNTIARTEAEGIVIEGGINFDTGEFQIPTGNRIIANTITAVPSGILLLTADDNQVTNNTVTGAGTFGDAGPFGARIFPGEATANDVRGNTVSRGRGPGIQVGDVVPDPDPAARPTDDNLLARNTAIGNAAAGILVYAVARGTTLTRNTANRNGEDGIHVLSPFTTITRNTADHNAAYGIEAVPGVTDGGRNHATGNGNPDQCTGVTCH